MKVRGITWLARAVPADAIDRMAEFGRTLGLTELAASVDGTVFTAEDGSVVEFCGPAYPVPPHLFADQDTVVGFLVDDVDEAAGALVQAGVELVGDPGVAGPVRFQHVRAPDGLIYGIIASEGGP